MRHTSRCPACAGRRLWHVARVPDRAGVTGAFVIWQGQTALAQAELFVCAACGVVEWYATGLPADFAPPPDARDDAGCPSCPGALVVALPAHDAIAGVSYGKTDPVRSGAESVPMSLRVDGDVAEGRLVLRVCLSCARIRWRATDRPGVGREGDVRESGLCASCGGAERFRLASQDLRSARYVGGIVGGVAERVRSDPRAVAVRPGFFGERPWGRLETIVCVACGEVSWAARDLHELKEDSAAGVRLVPIPDEAGPYR